jgi:hypothetical protein
MEEVNLTPEQQEAYQDSVERGQAFDQMIHTKGWGYVKAWYQNKIQVLATSLLLEDQKAIQEFEKDRQELIGIRKLLGLIESDIQIAKKDYEEHSKSAGKQK